MYTAPHTAAEQSLRSSRTYVELKTRLLRGDFGLNTRLGEERLAGLLDVSRTPVREALTRLSAEGLVRRGHDGGYSPIVPDVAGMKHLYEVRAELEVQALRRPKSKGATHDLQKLEELRRRWVFFGSTSTDHVSPDFVLADESFHETLSLSAGNPVAADLLHLVNERIRMVRMHDFLTLDRVEETVRQHLAIIDMLVVGDIEAAEQLFVEHLAESLAVVEQRVAQAIARMIDPSMTVVKGLT